MKKRIKSVPRYLAAEIPPIRDRLTLIECVVVLSKVFLSQKCKSEDAAQEDEIIVVPEIQWFFDKDVNRVYWAPSIKQIHSFCFPFRFNEANGELSGQYGISITYEYLECLLSLIRNLKNQSGLNVNLDQLYDEFADSLSNLNISDMGKENEIWALFMQLISFEPGYLRYDDDRDNSNGREKFHPQYHFDINYCGSGSYKIGLTSSIDKIITMQNVLDRKTECHFLHK